jgi:Ca2+-binding RTX toxin-like protein
MAGSPLSVAARRMRSTLALASLAALLLLIGLVLATGTSSAKKLRGTNAGDRIAGTAGADKINGRSGNDRIVGKGGKDTLNGGGGGDRIVGGKGVDRLMGGPGKDVINAADGRRDKKINGGPGKNKCVIDTSLELSIAKNCSSITLGQKGGQGGGPGGAGPGLQVLAADGIVCSSQLPICVFTITGDGADAPVGTVTGGGGVTALGAGVTISGSDWTAAGVYGCTADGFLRVNIGSESVDVPVDCTV